MTSYSATAIEHRDAPTPGLGEVGAITTDPQGAPAGGSTSDPEYDPEAGRRAYDEMRSRLAAVGELAPVNGKLALACVAVLRVASEIEERSEHARFAQLSGFDSMHLEHLRPLAWALWHALVELRKARAGSSRRRVDVELGEQATERKQRMLRVVGYHLADLPAAVDEIDDIRSDRGYVDLASDLTRLAALYEGHAAALATDRMLYDSADAAAARENAEAILRSLADGRTSEEQHWLTEVARAWTALLTSYGEVRAAAAWLFRGDPELDERFPSLHTTVRPRGGRPSATVEGLPASTTTDSAVTPAATA